MRAIEQFQIRKIYAIGNALGIKASGNEDELHVLVGGVTGKESIKSLTYQEACAVIARLEELQGKTASPKPRSKKPKEHQSRPGGVTSGQQKKIWYLMYSLRNTMRCQTMCSWGTDFVRSSKRNLVRMPLPRTHLHG